MAEGMNRICNGFKLNMKMENDIEYIAEPGKYIFNPSDWIDGNFNGQGHVFTIGMSDMGDKAALFPEMSGNVENLILKGSITTSGARAGSISGNARMALVRNVFSDIDITSSRVGDNTSGGMFGWTGSQEKRVENCIYAGTFTLPGAEEGADCARVGGFSGWTDQKTYYTNCAMLGNIIGAGDQTLDTNTENSQNIGRNPGNVIAENVDARLGRVFAEDVLRDDGLHRGVIGNAVFRRHAADCSAYDFAEGVVRAFAGITVDEIDIFSVAYRHPAVILYGRADPVRGDSRLRRVFRTRGERRHDPFEQDTSEYNPSCFFHFLLPNAVFENA